MVTFAAGLLDATVQAATVLILAGLGELITERAGVLNLGVEGMMLTGALGGFIATVLTGSHWLGFGVGVVCGVLLAAVHAFLCITPQLRSGDQWRHDHAARRRSDHLLRVSVGRGVHRRLPGGDTATDR
ncbi:MAG: ABC-type transport system, permease component [uncultured archaeon A07HN63]|nr:MAG: ABC-type transport system, permease component [uncultured archaeon A07HN63]